LLVVVKSDVALAAEGGLGLQDGLHQAPSHAETAAGKPQTAASDDERSIGSLDNEVLGRLAVAVGEQCIAVGVVDFNALPLAVVEWQLDSEGGVLGVIGLASLRVLGVGKHGIEDGVDDFSRHGLAEPLLGVGDGVLLDLGFKLLQGHKELAHAGGLVLFGGELERHAVGLHLAGLLVRVLVHAPGQHEGGLDVQRGIGRSIENADTLAACIVDLDFCVFDIGIGTERGARNDCLCGFSGHCRRGGLLLVLLLLTAYTSYAQTFKSIFFLIREKYLKSDP